jgi:hypothetical protein
MIERKPLDSVLKGNEDIKPSVEKWGRTIVPMIRKGWIRHHWTLLCLAVVLMAVLALLKLGTEFWRLLFDNGPNGAIDLRLFHELVHRWFTGRPVYSDLETAVYPPASFVILWPLLGWLAVTPARWLWAVTSTGAVGALAYLIVRKSGAETPLERAFVVLMLLSMNATGVTIGNGQLILHLLPLLVAGLCLTYPVRHGWGKHLFGAGLLLITLVKPNVSIPFFWIILFRPGGLRLAVLTSLGYAGLTFFAVSFQKLELLTLLREWLTRASAEAAKGGLADLHICLSTLGLKEWILPASLIVLAVLGFWVYCHRDGDRWLLLGVTALVARFWAYHRLYDNLLILLPMIALFQIAKRGSSVNGEDVTAGVLLGITMLVMLAPARLYIAPPPWNQFFIALQVIDWMAILIFLLHQPWEKKKKKLKPFSGNGIRLS